MSKPDCTCEFCVDDTVAKLRAEVERLKNLLRTIDFNLDEFGCGACVTPPLADVDAVPDAVDNAIAHLRRSLREKR